MLVLAPDLPPLDEHDAHPAPLRVLGLDGCDEDLLCRVEHQRDDPALLRDDAHVAGRPRGEVRLPRGEAGPQLIPCARRHRLLPP